METELINCSNYLNGTLKYFTKISIDVQVTKGQVYKEDLHKNIYNVIGRMNDAVRSSYILQIFDNVQVKDDSLLFSYQYCDGNCVIIEFVQMENNHFRMEYAEFRDGSLCIPNQTNIILPYIALLEASKTGQKEGSAFKLKIQNMVDSTMKSAFAPNYSPFTVNGIATITYILYDKTILYSDIENDNLIYNALRRFYQQYKSEIFSQIPYIELEKESFEAEYAAMWK